jgi:hypothetical protein
MQNARFDPQLKLLMEELAQVFEKHQVFGFVSTTSRTHGEFRWFLPKHSVMRIEEHQIRFKAKSGVDSHQDVEATVFALMSMRDQAAELFGYCERLASELQKHLQIDHKRGPVYGHGED